MTPYFNELKELTNGFNQRNKIVSDLNALGIDINILR